MAFYHTAFLLVFVDFVSLQQPAGKVPYAYPDNNSFSLFRVVAAEGLFFLFLFLLMRFSYSPPGSAWSFAFVFHFPGLASAVQLPWVS